MVRGRSSRPLGTDLGCSGSWDPSSVGLASGTSRMLPLHSPHLSQVGGMTGHKLSELSTMPDHSKAVRCMPHPQAVIAGHVHDTTANDSPVAIHKVVPRKPKLDPWQMTASPVCTVHPC